MTTNGEHVPATERETLSDRELKYLSLFLESVQGFDSIPTVHDFAERTKKGTLRCYVPGCNLTRPDATALWRHLHFSSKHGYSFGVKSPEEVVRDGR